MTLVFVIGFAFALGAAWHFKRRSIVEQSKTAPSGEKAAQRYAGVEIRCGKNACSSAKGLLNKKLLAATAPALPLAGCDAENCACAYRKWEDRRQEHRRTSDDGLEPIIFDGYEHRISDDRRDADCDDIASGF